MNNMNKAIALLLSLLMVISLCACKDKDSNNNNEDTELITSGQGTNINIADNKKIEIYDITTSKLLSAFTGVSDINSNFDISTSQYKTMSLDDYSNYILNNQFIVKCDPIDGQELVGDDFKISAIINYKGNNTYPSTIAITCEYINEVDREKAEVWTKQIFGTLTNQSVTDTLFKTAYNTRDAEAYTVDNLRVTVSKVVEDFTSSNGKYAATYSMNVVDTSKLTDETISAELDDFNPSDNAKYSLFNTPIISYSEKLSISTSRVGRFFNDTATANILEINDIHNIDSNSEYSKAKVNYEIKSRNNGDSFLIIEATKSVNNNGKESNIISINTKTLEYENKKDCFYAAEDLILNLVGKTVELDAYYDVPEFSITIDKDGLDYEFGYPAKVDCIINNSNDKYSISININTLEEVENAPETSESDT